MRGTPLSLMLASLLATVGCAPPPSGLGGAVPGVASLSLALQHANLQVGAPNRVIATARDTAGDPLDPAVIALIWSTSDSSVIDVRSDGGIIGRRVGSAVVAVSAGGIRAELPLSVAPGPPARSEISLEGRLERVGDRAAVRGFVVDALGNRIREIGVYCSCVHESGVASYDGRQVALIGTGQFLLSINDVDYGVPGTRRIFDIRQ